MFTFTRCLRSSAAVTPAKYELDIIQVAAVLIIRKKWKNNGTEAIGLVTPTLEWIRLTYCPRVSEVTLDVMGKTGAKQYV